LCFVAIACLRIAAAWPEMGLTFDEPGHFACGLEWVAQHVYRYESQHPPLARAMTAIGPYLLDGVRPTGNPDREDEGTGLLIHSPHPTRFLEHMRLGVLPFFLLAALVIFAWTRRHFGSPAAAIATALFTMLPPVLAHAGVATTDMGLAAGLGAAYFSLILWAEEPTWKHAVLLGIATAVAVLSKFTALGYLPGTALCSFLYYLWARKPGQALLWQQAKARAATFSLAVLTGALAIWACYWFSFGKVPGWGFSLPAPELFDGILSAARHNQEGHPSYLLGQFSQQGHWYYFPVVLAVKTPVAFLLLLAPGILLWWRKCTDVVYGLPVAFAAGILIPAMTSHVNIGVRHILPIYIGFAIVAALGLLELVEWERRRKWAGPAAALLVIWMAASGVMAHPNYLAYFNEPALALTAGEPEKILVDSDLEWGQNTVHLAARLKELGATEVSYGVANHRSDYLLTWPGLPHIRPIQPAIPSEGWTAVSPTIDKTTQYGLFFRYPNIRPWWEQLPPTERVGALSLYYVPPGSIRRVR
jgi:hypothetical protein